MDKSQPLVSVTLYLRGDLLDPAQVTLMLGTEGSEMRVKGEKRRTYTDQEVTNKIGLWKLKAKAESSSISDQIAWLRQTLSSASCSPLQIPGVQEAEISVFIGMGSAGVGDGDYESELTAQDLIWLSSFGAFVSFTLMYAKDQLRP